MMACSLSLVLALILPWWEVDTPIFIPGGYPPHWVTRVERGGVIFYTRSRLPDNLNQPAVADSFNNLCLAVDTNYDAVAPPSINPPFPSGAVTNESPPDACDDLTSAVGAWKVRVASQLVYN